VVISKVLIAMKGPPFSPSLQASSVQEIAHLGKLEFCLALLCIWVLLDSVRSDRFVTCCGQNSWAGFVKNKISPLMNTDDTNKAQNLRLE
jgi:hypothetical protein